MARVMKELECWVHVCTSVLILVVFLHFSGDEWNLSWDLPGVTGFDARCTDRVGWMHWMQAAASMGAFLGPILGGLLYDYRRLIA